MTAWAAIASGVLLRLFSLGRTYHLDELATLEQMQQPTIVAAMRWLREEGTHHPLFFFLFYFWHALCSERFWLRLFPCLFDVGTLVLVSLFCLQAAHRGQASLGHQDGKSIDEQPLSLFSSRQRLYAMFLAVALWATNPLALRFATEIRPYSALIFTTVLCFYACEWSKRTQSKSFTILLALAAVLPVCMHPAGFLSAGAVLFVYCVFDLRQCSRFFLAGVALVVATAALHWGFSLDPSAQKISWMPAMSWDLFVRMVGVSYGMEDSQLYGGLSRSLYLHGATGVLLVTWLWAMARQTQTSRAAVASAAMLLVLVSVYSIVMQPIFWYRSIAPAIALTALGAGMGLVTQTTRARVLLLSFLVLWHTGIAVALAPRAVDPCEPAAKEVISLTKGDEPIYTFPDWLAVAFRYDEHAFAHPKATFNAKETFAPGGVLFVRWEGTQYDNADGIGPLMRAAKEKGFRPRAIVVISNDNDDTSEVALTVRDDMLAKMVSTYPSCRSASDRHARFATLICD